jgi:type IV pilus assembly protein PilP
MKRAACFAAAVLGLSALGACTADNDELIQWMEQQHKEVKPNVAPIYPPKKFDPQAYLGFNGVEPFGSQKMVAAGGGGASSERSNAVLAAAKAHPAQELESYPLDGMTMVGTLHQGGRSHALVMVDNRLHDVKVGDYMGQNYGQITKISDTEITLRETVQDATGEWIERTSTLQIQEKAR